MALPLTIGMTIPEAGDCLALVVEGELDYLSGPNLLAVIRGALDTQPHALEIDLSNVSFMDSGGVDALVAADNRAREVITHRGCGCELRIVRPSQPAQVALWAAGVDGYLEIVDRPEIVPHGPLRPRRP